MANEKFIPGGVNVPGYHGMRTFFSPPGPFPTIDNARPAFLSANGTRPDLLRTVVGVVGAALVWGSAAITPAQPVPVAAQYEYGTVRTVQASKSYGEVWGPQLGVQSATVLPVVIYPTPQVGVQIPPIVQGVLIQQFQAPSPPSTQFQQPQVPPYVPATVWGQDATKHPLQPNPLSALIDPSEQATSTAAQLRGSLWGPSLVSAPAVSVPASFVAPTAQQSENRQPSLTGVLIQQFQAPQPGSLAFAIGQLTPVLQPTVQGQRAALIPPAVGQNPQPGGLWFSSPQVPPIVQPTIAGQDATSIPIQPTPIPFLIYPGNSAQTSAAQVRGSVWGPSLIVQPVTTVPGGFLIAGPQRTELVQPVVNSVLIQQFQSPPLHGPIIPSVQLPPVLQPMIRGQSSATIPPPIVQAPTFGPIVVVRQFGHEYVNGVGTRLWPAQMTPPSTVVFIRLTAISGAVPGADAIIGGVPELSQTAGNIPAIRSVLGMC